MHTRDGVRLATDLYLPLTTPAPVIATRTPYGRADSKLIPVLQRFARAGYAVVSQDCRGTGDSEPESWDYYVYEADDSVDFVEWVRKQEWFGGFLGAFGGSYAAQTQWCMSLRPTTTIVPEVSGLGFAINTAHLYMGLSAYARSVGRGPNKIPIRYQDLERQMIEETLAGGYFNEPLWKPLPEALLEHYPQLRGKPPAEAQRWLWERYCTFSGRERADLIKLATGQPNITILEMEAASSFFGHRIPHDAHTVPSTSPQALCRKLHAPALMITGWYDWGLNDALETWAWLRGEAVEPVRSQSRLIITPAAHGAPGYHEGAESHPELQRNHRTASQLGLLLRWYEVVRADVVESWPRVIYYLMGAHEWRFAEEWPPNEVEEMAWYLGPDGSLGVEPPSEDFPPDTYMYDPRDPTPTFGGSIVSSVYRPGSVDVHELSTRADTLSYTSQPLEDDLDVVGPVRVILYASSSTVDTDFCARLSDVFPDGRAIQLQNGILRARYRGETPALLEPEKIYRLEIDLWATANRFRRGHRLRVDITSADFPRFDRNANLGGGPGVAIIARQQIHRDAEHPSHLLVCRAREGQRHG
jgi:predicted acyl esterase